jgi:FkbM family methyltransferase
LLVDLLAKVNDRVLARVGLYVTNSNRNFRDVVRYELATVDTTVALDVGASRGQYGEWLRSIGFKGRILSFEPGSTSFRQLASRAKADGMWQAFNCGLGSQSTAADLHIAGNQVSSSLLPMTELHATAAEGSATIATETVTVRPLDEVMAETTIAGTARIHVKIDVQGFEREVLRGAEALLADPRLRSIEIELSTAPLYDSQSDWLEILGGLRRAGFELASMSGGFFDKRTRRMLQFDALLVRPA